MDRDTKRLGALSLSVETVVLMVIAVIALALLWSFFSGQLKFASFGLEGITKGFKDWFCNNLLGGVKGWAICKLP
ncbi:MAG: hypothetical protein HY361_03675 [Candidatus Aenigmarchaeota archaeon]|nr:hypothetical protein [Candidatus Aenigmarchaeota archaeon]